MNTPNPQELREIAQSHRRWVDLIKSGREQSARQYDLSAQALERWANQLEHQEKIKAEEPFNYQNPKIAAEYRAKAARRIDKPTTPHTDKG